MRKEINGKTFKCHEQSGLYVSRDGEVLFPANPNSKSRWKNERTTYGWNNTKGYKQVEYHGKKYRVHRLVAETYIPNPNNLPFINHKDETPSNNFVENLEWCTAQYNNTYGTRTQRAKEKQINNVKKSKPVAQYDLSGNLIAVFPSTREVQRTLGYNNRRISACCNGEQKTHGGYKWKYS